MRIAYGPSPQSIIVAIPADHTSAHASHMKTLLFDIDGTLIVTNETGTEALKLF